ncbi:MAG: hypothetical protein ACREIA_15445, partial [Opitutaceae bacterium]
LRGAGAANIGVLGAGAAARGAAVLACHRQRPESIEDVPVESSIVPPEQARDPLAALQAAFLFKRQPGARGAAPTHVVLEGNAHVLKPPGLRVAAGGTQGDRDLALALAPAGVGACELVLEGSNGDWNVAAVVSGRRVSLPGGETAVAAGDILEVHGNPGIARLLFVRLVD